MTKAVTTSVSGTDALAAGVGKVLSDPGVIGSIGGLAGSLLDAGLGAVGLGSGKQTPAQIAAAAAAAAEKKKAERTQMLVIGGGIALVVVVVVIVMMHRSRK